MQITSQMTDEAILSVLGERLARTRLERNLTQAQLADEAGVGKATVERIEAGHPAKLPSFIRVLRTLDLLDGLDRLAPEPTPSPIERLKLQGRQRMRASSPRAAIKSDGEAGLPWAWGDELEPDP